MTKTLFKVHPIKHYELVAMCNLITEMSLLWTSGGIQTKKQTTKKQQQQTRLSLLKGRL